VFKGNYFGNWRALAWCVDEVIGGHSVSAIVHYEDTKLLVFPECDWGNYVSPIYCTSVISTSAAGLFVELEK
jgi:hypothetical protein